MVPQRRVQWAAIWNRYRHLLAVYAASRVLLMLLALIDAAAHHANIGTVLSNWDGVWYVLIPQKWYGHVVLTKPGQYSTLGFLPLFPMFEWLLAHATSLSIVASGVTLSLIFGLTATILVTELAKEWWGEEAADRALLFWCLFPGTVVFSMVYTEGLLITLVAGCLMLLARRRWAWAGLLAGLSTAVGPVAVAAVAACIAASGREIYYNGWRDREARKSLWAPILSPFGLVGFGIFLWFWCGTPLASFKAQHGAWSEKSTPFAIFNDFGSLVHQMFISGVGKHGPGGIDLNIILALFGTAFLFYGLWRLWQVRETLPLPAWVWTVGMAVLALTSQGTPPNPRMLICAFPVVLIVGAEVQGHTRKRLLTWEVICLIVMSLLTFVGFWLRP